MTGTTRELEVVGPGGRTFSSHLACEEESPMKGPLTIIGIVLLVLGLISFAYQGITYTKSEKVLEVGPITATKETKKTIPLSPVVGGAAVLGGIVLLVAGSRSRA
jgi:hypothetical protein